MLDPLTLRLAAAGIAIALLGAIQAVTPSAERLVPNSPAREAVRLMPAPSPETGVPDPAEATYRVEGQAVTLRSGRSATRAIRLGDLRAYGDLNGDGRTDLAVVLTGPEESIYLAALLNGDPPDGVPAEALLLGRRLLLEGLEVVNGEVILRYHFHSPHLPEGGSPSVDVFRVEGGRLRPWSKR